jgi:uncharacterized protein
MSQNTQALIVFQKNFILGKVKTRLAAGIGDHAALNAYKYLTIHTFKKIADLKDTDIFIFFNTQVEAPDAALSGQKVFTSLQKGSDLGEKMKNAFAEVRQLGYKSIAIIGTDCPGISSTILDQAFAELVDADVVFGPAMDGGYYLLGMKEENDFLFEKIPWSTADVLNISATRCKDAGLKYCCLEELRDIDTEEDWLYFEPLLLPEDEYLFRNN